VKEGDEVDEYPIFIIALLLIKNNGSGVDFENVP
jgi:hypothetical protein